MKEKGVREEWSVVESAGDGPAGLRLAHSGVFALVLLDLSLRRRLRGRLRLPGQCHRTR